MQTHHHKGVQRNVLITTRTSVFRRMIHVPLMQEDLRTTRVENFVNYSKYFCQRTLKVLMVRKDETYSIIICTS